MAKKRNIKKVNPQCCSKYLKEHFYQFLGQVDHFSRSCYDFRRNFFFDFRKNFEKKTAFLPEPGAIFGKNPKIFGNQ
jgi:hypothetical protein